VDFALIWNYLPYLLRAGLVTIEISLVSLVFGSLIGLGLTFARISSYRTLQVLVWLYVWLIRGTPLLLQIFVIYYWLPGYGVILPAFVAGVAALSLNAAAYYVDIFRAAILAVPTGQVEAGHAIGMRPWQIMRKIVIPLSIRPALPPYIGQSINLVKNSSLVSVISVQELMYTSQSIYSSTYKVAEILGTAGLIYLLINTVLQGLQTWLEKRLSYYTVR
jgi:His/Glu/Gln/Arg/opine family amino acid ABC transporter permease subunit